ncbi:AAA family ATPase [Luteolibacter marinus]|uniref:AAA family ATPase n=1 Tax=Luteolibacter marinus TaxID=2776705 RepID=UPI001867F54B|nr:AAA family ATPase [Luteolibacter marinus]
MGKSGYTRKECGQRLAASLEEQLGLYREDPARSELKIREWPEREAWEKDKAPGEMNRPALVTAEGGKSLDLVVADAARFPADALILDRELRTLGLIHYLDGDDAGKVELILEQAAYLRHLLDEQAEANEPKIMVEVVLVVLRWDKQAEAVAKALREISSSTSILHSIGVSLLKAEHHGDGAALRRAFSWMLGSTRKWMAGLPGSAGGVNAKPRLTELVLEHFRVSGERRWLLEPRDGRLAERVVVVHGPNGSGKSSLVESLELLVTGKIARIERERERRGQPGEQGISYRNVLTHGGPGSGRTLRIEARFSDGPAARRFTVEENGCIDPLGQGFRAAGFRLDQRMSNDLIFGTPGQRAAILLDAFFPEEREKIRRFRRAEEQYREVLAAIPPALIEEHGGEDALPEGWSDIAPMAMPAAYVPLVADALHLIEDWMDRLTGEGAREEQWRSFLHWVDLTTRHAEVAGEALERLSRSKIIRARMGRSRTRGGFETLHNEWLRSLAKIDLLRRELVVTRTLVRARKLGWKSEPKLFAGIRERTGSRQTELENQIASLESRIDELATELADIQRGETGHDPEAASLSAEEVEALDGVGRYLDLTLPGTTGFGQLLKSWIDGHPVHEPETGGKWDFRDLIRDARRPAQALVRSMRSVARRREALEAAPPAIVAAIEKLKQVRGDLHEHDAGIIESLQERVKGGLSPVLNELMAIMTPARWAYEDVSMATNGDELSLDSGGLDVAVKLNTAELNTLSLAMFLALAMGRKDNPLQMVVLDDPFENMDELTTITVARAICRLNRLWGRFPYYRDWRLVLMLHGAENVERIREEVPCEVYFLPWLVPGDAIGNPPGETEIDRESTMLEMRESKLPLIEQGP